MSPPVPTHRCGVVALLGRPNAGKSTLLNAVLGEKISIAAARAQTTRSPLLGVLTLPEAQILFRDTPGVNRGRARFNVALTETALKTAEDADLRVILLEATASWDTPEERLAQIPGPSLLVRTKCDLGEVAPVADPDRFQGLLEVSASTGRGLGSFVERVSSLLPAGPALYPEDFLTDAPMRFLAAELIREVVFETYREEIPYAIAVEIESWQEAGSHLRLAANLLVERESQKGIVVGEGGRMLKQVGSQARQKIAQLAGQRVHLDLWVKTDKNWSKRPKRARQLGYL